MKEYKPRNSNYEWNKQQTQQRLGARYAEAELARQVKQSEQQRQTHFVFASALSAVWHKLSYLRGADSERPVRPSGQQQAQQT